MLAVNETSVVGKCWEAVYGLWAMVHSAAKVIWLPRSVPSAGLILWQRGDELFHALVHCTATCLCFSPGTAQSVGLALWGVFAGILCSNFHLSFMLHFETFICCRSCW